MATFSKNNLTVDNFMTPVYFTKGRGKDAKVDAISNFYDLKMDFLNKDYMCTVYTLKAKAYLPNISYKFYGTTSLWWVIARFNGILFPLKEIQIGTKLFIPRLSDLSKIISQNNNTTSSSSSGNIIKL